MNNQIIQPDSLEALQQALGDDRPKALVAGGTDILVRFRTRPPENTLIIDLSQVAALKGYGTVPGGFRIGAMCTMTELEESQEVQHQLSVLSKAASQVGSTQIRNTATLGGNIANAAQCADTIPALIALNAAAELMDSRGNTRSILVDDLVRSIGKTLIQENEVITGFLVPNPYLSAAGGYWKVGSREAVTIAKVNCSAVFRIAGDAVQEARVSFGSLGERAFFSESVSKGLTGLSLDEMKSEKALEFFIQQVDAAIPGRASLSYKRMAIKAVAEAVIQQALGDGR